MGSAIVSCTTFATPYKGPHMGWIDILIDSQTTVDEFNYRRKQWFDNLQLSNGDLLGLHPLAQAATKGNLIMIQSIFDEGGSTLLTLGDKFGSIPLHSAVQHFQTKSVELLLSLGSPINVRLTESFYVSGFEYLAHAGATPLDTAVKTQSFAIIKILLKYEGVLNLPVTEEQNRILENVQKEIAKERASLVFAIDEATGNNTFPNSLRELIADYAL
jgi:ankyrin repeat protein